MLSFQLKGSVMITAIHFLKAAEWQGLTRAKQPHCISGAKVVLHRGADLPPEQPDQLWPEPIGFVVASVLL